MLGNDSRTSGITVMLMLMLVLVAVIGCATTGPASIRTQRHDYNAALRQTNDEQMLMNIVRLRYGETPSFLEVTGIVVQLTFERSAQLGAAAGAIETLVMLWESGWSFKRAARVCIERLGPEENVPRASGPTPGQLEVPRGFAELLDAMAPLIRAGKVRFVTEFVQVREETRRRIVLSINRASMKDPDVQDVVRRLGLNAGLEHYPVVTDAELHGAETTEGERLVLRTRSLLGIMFLLANSIEVPKDHARSGAAVTATTEASREPFDWTTVTAGVFQVPSATERPPSALVAVQHRGRWFYIDDTDSRSKATFLLLTQLYALQSAPPTTGGPSLVLPVGGR